MDEPPKVKKQRVIAMEEDAKSNCLANGLEEEMYNNYLWQEKKIEFDYIERSNKKLVAKYRAIIIDWMVEVHHMLQYEPGVLYRAIYLLDCFLQKESMEKEQLQLVASVALWVSGKVEERNYKRPPVDYVQLSLNDFSRAEFLKMEERFLRTLDYKVTMPTSYVFLMHLIELIKPPEKVTTTKYALYFMERALQEYDFLKFTPSEVATASLMLSLQYTEPNGDERLPTKYTPCSHAIQTLIRHKSSLNVKTPLVASRNKYFPAEVNLMFEIY